jgi:hypothetical protein
LAKADGRRHAKVLRADRAQEAGPQNATFQGPRSRQQRRTDSAVGST